MAAMTPEEVGERMVALLAGEAEDAAPVSAGVSAGGPGHERAVVERHAGDAPIVGHHGMHS